VRPIVPPLFKGVEGSTAGHENRPSATAACVPPRSPAWPPRPCMVRAMTDEEARCAQIAENLQRADMHPHRRGRRLPGLDRSPPRKRRQHPRASRQHRSYVYGRLKLLAYPRDPQGLPGRRERAAMRCSSHYVCPTGALRPVSYEPSVSRDGQVSDKPKHTPGTRERQPLGGRTRTAGFKQGDRKRECPQSTPRDIHLAGCVARKRPLTAEQ
jgi:hypothetical protein